MTQLRGSCLSLKSPPRFRDGRSRFSSARRGPVPGRGDSRHDESDEEAEADEEPFPVVQEPAEQARENEAERGQYRRQPEEQAPSLRSLEIQRLSTHRQS